MVIRNFYEPHISQASYLIGCPGCGEAIVIDPNRNIEPYLTMAEELGLQITAVTETHIHADYLSGTRELAAATGATIYLSAEGGDDWRYSFADEDKAKLLHDGDEIK